jgi:hypothetical protein
LIGHLEGIAMASIDKAPGPARSGILLGFAELDRLLRGELTRVSTLQRGAIELSPVLLSLVVIVLCFVYGACMGTFALFSAKGANFMQVVASMVKVPVLFFLTLLVTLPSLYVFNALVGSRLTFSSVARLLVASLGVIVAVLASLGPIVAFFSVSTTSYPFILLLNVAVFTVSGVLGMMFLLQTLHRLSVARLLSGERDLPPESAPEPSSGALDRVDDQALNRHVLLIFRLWLIVFGLVGAQMGWVLRPFVGNPNIPFAWFRGRESNFFQAVLHTFINLFA